MNKIKAIIKSILRHYPDTQAIYLFGSYETPNEQRIYCQDEYAADEFEMLVYSKYQKLEEERKEIVEPF